METKNNIVALSGSSRKKSSTQKALNSLNKFISKSVNYESNEETFGIVFEGRYK